MKKLLLLLGLCTGLVGCGSLYESPLDNLQKIKKDLLHIKGRATNYKTLDRFKYYSFHELKETTTYINPKTFYTDIVYNQPYQDLKNMIKNEYGREGVRLLEQFNKISYDALLQDFPNEREKLTIAAQTDTGSFYGVLNLAERCESYRLSGYTSWSEYQEYGRRKAKLYEKEIEDRKAKCNIFKDSFHPLYNTAFYIEMLEKYLGKYYQ